MKKDIQVKTENIYIKETYDQLKEELSKLYTEKAILLTTKKTNIEQEYWTKIGIHEYKLFCITTEVLRLKRKIELIRLNLNQSKRVILLEIELELEKEFVEWQEKVDKMNEQVKRAEMISLMTKLTLEESNEIKRLYRICCKRLHPDLNPDITEGDKALWERVISSYNSGDLHEIRVLYSLIESNKELGNFAEKSNNFEFIHVEINRYKDMILKLINEIAKISMQFPFNIEDDLSNDEWVNKKVTEINIKIDEWIISKDFYLEEIEKLYKECNL